MANTLEAWHFLRNDGCLSYPPHTKVEVGQTLSAKGKLVLCQKGMHASRRAIDALSYAPGNIVCWVVLSGQTFEDTDKLVARNRTVLWMADATHTLHDFACWCAEQALLNERVHGREPDPLGWAAIETKRRWLKGDATDAELDAARKDAWAAARDAARAAAWAAQNEQLEKMLRELEP